MAKLITGDVVTFYDNEGPLTRRTVKRVMARFVEFEDGSRWTPDLRHTWPRPKSSWARTFIHGRKAVPADAEAILDRNTRARAISQITAARFDDWTRLDTRKLRQIAEWLAEGLPRPSAP